MKRYVKAADRRQMRKELEQGFTSADDCVKATVINVQPTYCVVELTFKDGSKRQVNCWFDMIKQEKSSQPRFGYAPWSPNYSLTPEGRVLDANNEDIGEAVVKSKIGDRKNYDRDYQNYRVDVGDHKVQELDTTQDYEDAVNALHINKTGGNV